MRVLVDYRPALRARTGIGEYVHELTRALAAAAPPGCFVTAFSASWRDRVTSELASEAPAAAIVDRRIPVRALTWSWHRLGWPPAELLAGSVDVVHSPTPLLIPARRAAQVVTVFDLHFLTNPEHASGAVGRDFVPLSRAHVARADHVIAGSAYAARLVTDTLGIAATRITTTPLGAPRWAPAVAATRNARPGQTLLFIGTLERRKNLGLLLDAYARLLERRPDAPPLVVAGKTGDGAAQWVERALAPPLAGRVVVTGYVDDARRRALFAEARAVVIPSLDEGFGLPAVEAMACGVPVIASPVGALPDVIGDAGLFAPLGAPDAWADALEAVLDDERAMTLAARGLARAALYSWASTAAATWGAYEAAVKTKADRRR